MISIIIPMHNASKYIGTCLQHISRLKFADYEAVIIDDASTDNSYDIAKQAGFTPIRRDLAGGPAVARNLGAQNSKGEFLFFVDADVYLNPDALDRFMCSMNAYPEAAGAVFIYSLEHPNKNLVSLYKNFSIRTEEMGKPDFTPAFRFSAFGMKREALETIGGFDDALCCEELEFGLKAKEHNLSFYLDKGGNVIHAKSCSFRELVRGDFIRAFTYFKVFLKNYKRILKNYSGMAGSFHAPIIQLIGVALVGVFLISSFFYTPAVNLALCLATLMVIALAQIKFLKAAYRAYGLTFTAAAFLLRNLEIAIGEIALVCAMVNSLFKKGQKKSFSTFTYLKAVPRIIFKKGPPLQLIYFVTSKCNSNCIHCFLRGKLNKEANILTVDEIERVAKTMPSILSLSLTGGEPFLRGDLPEIARIFYRNTGFRNLVIATNGLDGDRTISHTEKIISDCQDVNIFIGLSFDGLEGTHNTIRGTQNAFTKTKDTFFRLKELKNKYKNLSVGTCVTCSEHNQNDLFKLYDFLLGLGPDGIGINLMRGSGWRQYIDGIDINAYQEFASRKLADWREGRLKHSNIRYNKLLYAKEKLQYDLISKVYSERKFITPCYAGNLIAVMREAGDVYPCEMIKEHIGNIRDFDYNFARLWSSKSAHHTRRDITKSRCFCTYECATTSNILFNPRYYYRLMREILSYG